MMFGVAVQSITKFCSHVLQRINPFKQTAPAKPKVEDRWNDTYEHNPTLRSQDGGYRRPQPQDMRVDGGYRRRQLLEFYLSDPVAEALRTKVVQLSLDLAIKEQAGASETELAPLRQQLAEAKQAYAKLEEQHLAANQD